MKPFGQIVLYSWLFLCPGLGFAEPKDWLPPGSSTEMVGNKPLELFRPGTIFTDQLVYGRLLFRSPEILGEKAVRIGLSCDSCHTNGHINSSFYIDGLSDEPGRIDVSHRFWQAGFGDGTVNPLPIPTLRDVAQTAPYGTQIILAELADFTRHVTETEFGGPRLSQKQLQALVAYMTALDESGQEMEGISYFHLLDTPLKNQDFRQIDALVDFIRADIRRQLTTKNQLELHQRVKALKDLKRKAAAGDYVVATEIFQSLPPQ